jgi:hypothetical protein
MPSLMQVFTQVCTHHPPLIAPYSHKDVMTAIKYLASAYGTTTEKLAFTPDIEAGYREQLRAYFDQHHKGHSTIRNTLQYLAQLWKAFHQLNQTPLVPKLVPRVPTARDAFKRMNEQSPYRHMGWCAAHQYVIPPEQWPEDIPTQWDAFATLYAHDVRSGTVTQARRFFRHYVSYLLLSDADRIALLPDEAQEQLQTEKYKVWLREITTPTMITSWDELFDLDRLNSFITWSVWRTWRWHDPVMKEKEPQRPSSLGQKITAILVQVTKRTAHPKYPEINHLFNKLQKPLKMHNKKDPIHRFELSELEVVALELIAEARRMRIRPNRFRKYPGKLQAKRFQLGLMLQLAWRNPMRARNWCEALLGHNLKKDEHGQWRWRFVGEEMKVGMRDRKRVVNVFEPDVPPEVAGHLEEFLSSYRPKLPNAATDRHVFLSQDGGEMTVPVLLLTLRTHVNRYTNKRLYTHLLRSLFSTHHLSHGMDINSVAFALNDTPQSVLLAYNELMEDTHRPIIADANRQALANGYKP